MKKQAEEAGAEWDQRLTVLDEKWKAEYSSKERECEAQADKIRSLKKEVKEKETEKGKIRKELEKENKRLDSLLKQQEGDVLRLQDYLDRQRRQPSKRSDIFDWAAKEYAGRLFMHKKASDKLKLNDLPAVETRLICDVLDYLATDYHEWVFERNIDEFERDRRAKLKYGRSFPDVVPNSKETIEAHAGAYKIYYGRKDRAMDWHLRIGVGTENYLRVYFFHDNVKKVIVIGALPGHLPTMARS